MSPPFSVPLLLISVLITLLYSQCEHLYSPLDFRLQAGRSKSLSSLHPLKFSSKRHSYYQKELISTSLSSHMVSKEVKQL
jgi:hypothetical protein